MCHLDNAVYQKPLFQQNIKPTLKKRATIFIPKKTIIDVNNFLKTNKKIPFSSDKKLVNYDTKNVSKKRLKKRQKTSYRYSISPLNFLTTVSSECHGTCLAETGKVFSELPLFWKRWRRGLAEWPPPVVWR